MIKKSIKETIWAFGTKGMTAILFYCIGLVLANTLGVEKFGQWSFYYSFIIILTSLSSLGINAAIKKFIAEHNNTENLSKVIANGLFLKIVYMVVGIVILGLSFNYLLELFNRTQYQEYIWITLCLICLKSFVEFYKSVFIGIHRIKYNFIINTIEFSTKLILILTFVNSLNFKTIILSYCTALFLVDIASPFLLKKYIDFKKISLNHKINKEIFWYSIPFIFIGLGFLLLTEIDTLMLGYFSTDYQVGIYNGAKQIVIKLPQISLAIAMGVMPVFAKLNSNNKDALKQKFKRLLLINSCIFIPIVLVLFLYSESIILLLYKKEYLDSAHCMRYMLPYLFLTSYSILLSSFLDYTGKAKIRAFNIAGTIVLNIILNYVLIPKFGANGAAIATSVSYLPYFMLNLFWVSKSLK